MDMDRGLVEVIVIPQWTTKTSKLLINRTASWKKNAPKYNNEKWRNCIKKPKLRRRRRRIVKKHIDHILDRGLMVASTYIWRSESYHGQCLGFEIVRLILKLQPMAFILSDHESHKKGQDNITCLWIGPTETSFSGPW